MFKYKEKTAFTYNIQSIVHCRKLPFEPLEKCMTFKDIFPGLSRTLSFNFQDFPGPKCRLRNDLYCVEWDVKLYYTIPYQDQRDFPGLSRSWNIQEKNPGLSRRRGNPEGGCR